VAGGNALSWDGRAQNGAYVPDGDYTLHFTARDKSGTNGVGKTRGVRAIGLLSAVKTSVKAFYPQDADRLAPTTTLSFGLARPATATWTIRNAANEIVVTRLADAAVGAGTQTWAWDGRTTEGVLLPVGTYTSSVSATDGQVTISQSVKVDMNAFAIASSTSTLRRGQKVTVTVTSAEPLSSGVLLYVSQPGVTMWHVTMTKIDSRTSRATITIKNAGSAGSTRFLVKARDLDGRTQSTVRYLALS
jgi:flagellar hook assembly protein FlgD